MRSFGHAMSPPPGRAHRVGQGRLGGRECDAGEDHDHRDQPGDELAAQLAQCLERVGLGQLGGVSGGVGVLTHFPQLATHRGDRVVLALLVSDEHVGADELEPLDGALHTRNYGASSTSAHPTMSSWPAAAINRTDDSVRAPFSRPHPVEVDDTDAVVEIRDPSER